MNVFDLFAKISLNTDDYTKGLNDASQETSSFGSKLKNGLGTAAKVGAAAVGTIATTAVAVGKSLYNQASATAQYGDTVDKMSQKIGISAEAYQKWDYVMQLAGADISGLQVGMKTLSSVIVDAANGTDTATAKLTAAGIAIDELNGLSQEEQLNLVINRLQQMEAGAERTAAATDLLGRSAMELAPLLNMTAEETNAAMKEAEDYGMVMSDTAVKDAAAFQDSLTKLSSTFTGLKNTIFADFMPGITSIISGLADLVAGNDEAADKLSNGIGGILEKVVSKIPQILGVVEKIFQSVVAAIMQNLPTITKAATNIIITIAKELIKQLPVIIKAGYDIITSLIEGIADSLPDLIDAVIDVVLQIFEALTSSDSLSKLMDAAGKLLQALAQGLLDAIPKVLAALPTIINNILNFFLSAIPQIIEVGVTLLTSLVDALPQIIDVIVEVLPQIIDSIVDTLLDHLDQIIEAGVELFTAIVTDLPRIILTITSKIPEIIAKIVAKFGEMFPRMIEIGKQMLAGLWEGIKNNAKMLWDKITGWLKDLWNGILGFFGIHSPSTEMRWVGQMLVEGLSSAIDEDGRKAIESAKNLSRDISNAFSGIEQGVDVPVNVAGIDAISTQNQRLRGFATEDTLDSSLTRQQQNITVILELDKMQLAKAVYNLNKQETQRIGVRLSNA